MTGSSIFQVQSLKRSAIAVAAFGMVLPLVGAASTASAVPISLVNAGFETADTAGDVAGWSEVDFNNETWRVGTLTAPSPWAALAANPEGTRVGYIDGAGSMWQKTTHELTDGESYSVSAWFGNRNDRNMRPTDLVLYADNGSGGLGSVLASASIPNQGTTGAIPESAWQKLTVSFDTNDVLNSALVSTNLGRDLHVFIGHSLDETGGGAVVVDDVQLSYTPVPEPAALSLLSVGALVLNRRRRQ